VRLFPHSLVRFFRSSSSLALAVAPEYFSHLDMSQRRMDLDVRPELRLGSVDFVVNREYWVQDNASSPGGRGAPREPTPLHYIFAIDVSWSSVRCGLVKEVTESLKSLLFPPKDEDLPEGDPSRGRRLPPGAKVGIVTFDRTVQFYNLRVRTPPLDPLPSRIAP
jgi:protein transport protein SEC24